MKYTPSPANEDAPPTLHYCYDWITPEDAVRHALAAFYACCRFQDLQARTFPEDGFTNRANWVDDFVEILKLRVTTQLGTTGIPIPGDTEKYLQHFIEPAWHSDILSKRDTPDDIHCRHSQNEKAA